ncbi:ferredoxin--NADP reductase [Flavobacterium sp. LS1R47]|uniref:Ferredoxin--NADP reductase n=1 Tax=Flavobacterium frigoritolerans TaxID=2987686 RepID=A0A9X3C0R2_9FLAO|nr:ferredoxin--NADP reductase [Flavobacterium frigoritolerans]MCV9931286.1 ferredoxin--NADP reductase [Flavobacterium frigoritolerans]
MKNYTLKVLEVRKETIDTVTLCFKQPGLKKIKYLAGQYLTLQFRINGRRYIRPYSFSSTPSVDSTLNVTVKRVSGGIVSNYINDTIRVDDVIEVQQPLGDFIFDENQLMKSVVFWGVGSGITPLFSIIKELLTNQSLINVYLIYGNKLNSSVIFKSQLEELKKTYSKRFKVWNFYSREEFFEENTHNHRGRIHSDFIEKLMRDVENPSKHFICGPKDLKNTVKETLLNLGFLEDNILSEEFELVKNPEDFIGVETQKITLKFESKVIDLDVLKGKSVLEAALDVDVELPYSCQIGNCNTCKAVLKSGEMKMIGLNKLRKDLNENEYLLCCSYPLTKNVSVEI